MINRMDEESYEDTEDSVGIVLPILSDCDKDDDFSAGTESLNDILPILALRDMVLFPGVAMPVSVGRKQSLSLVKEANKNKALIGVVTQINSKIDDPEEKDLFHLGTVAEILRVLEMPDGTTTVILQGKKKFKLDDIVEDKPYMKGKVTLIDETKPEEDDSEFNALMAMVKEVTIKIIKLQSQAPKELLFSIKNNRNILYLVNFACSNLSSDVVEKQKLLSYNNLRDRTFRLISILNQEYQLLKLKENIQLKTHEDLSKQQKEYFLQQQMRNIQEELGGDENESEIKELSSRGKKMKWPEKVSEQFDKEIRKLERLHPQSPDYSTQYQYVDFILSLPWQSYSKDNFSLKHAERVLNSDHFGMEKVKERILEHLSVLKLKKDLKAPIICLYGPPGVGKTSLGKSIASALGRKYVRMSLGGLHDETEIRGHRRTYIGAMSGRILKGIRRAGTSNPVIVLDEVDKIASDFKGDPSSALLEVLDPEQNNTFHDNYLDIDYDLSKVMFIATANDLSTVSRALLDRMELIEVSSYITEEKVEIAAKHLVPRLLEAHGLTKEELKLPKRTLRLIIDDYTRESGVRGLEKKIAKLMRKVARKVASNEDIKELYTILPKDVPDYLGPKEVFLEKYQGNDSAGVVTGLAWTSVGGEILFVESSLSKGKGGKLTLTGNLGDVMKESAMLALEYIHSHALSLGIDEKLFESWNVHIHVPEGAIPKDGPSAGITMVTSLVSAFTQRKVKKNLAMTGEITLRGRVMPVGGIREKILAAKRAGIKELILCEENKKDIEIIKDDYVKGLTFYYVHNIEQVIDLALTKEKVTNPIKLV